MPSPKNIPISPPESAVTGLRKLPLSRIAAAQAGFLVVSCAAFSPEVRAFL